MQENSSIKEKILYYLNFKGITKYKFYKDTGITRGILDQKNGLTEDNLLKFVNYAQDISLEWLILGRGELLKSINVREKVINTKKSEDLIYYELFEKQKEEIRELNREIGRLQLTIEQTRKGNNASDFIQAAEPQSKYKRKD
jgi:hypothetical protein